MQCIPFAPAALECRSPAASLRRYYVLRGSPGEPARHDHGSCFRRSGNPSPGTSKVWFSAGSWLPVFACFSNPESIDHVDPKKAVFSEENCDHFRRFFPCFFGLDNVSFLHVETLRNRTGSGCQKQCFRTPESCQACANAAGFFIHRPARDSPLRARSPLRPGTPVRFRRRIATRRLCRFSAATGDASSPDAFGCFLAGLRPRAPPSRFNPDRALR